MEPTMSNHATQQLINTIIHLSEKLQDEHALPQATISFKEQSFKVLKFTVILLRILDPQLHTPSLQELSKLLPFKVSFIPERVANVGTLHEKYVKEANVFTLEIESRLFLRKNHTVNLEKARDYIVDVLKKMSGPFKDCTDLFLPQQAHPPTYEEKEENIHVLHLHLPRAAQSLDPRSGFDRTSGVVIKMLYEGLCRITENDEVELGLAEAVAISEDKKKYTFILKDTQWSNGAPLTAYDFEYAWKKTLEPDFRSTYSFLFFPIKNAEAVKRGEISLNQVGIHALDNKTLQIQLEYPSPFFLGLTANWIYSPLYREIDQKHPGWAHKSNESYICNGPFKLMRQSNDENIQLMKNPCYWDTSSVKLDQIRISIVDNEKSALKLFNNGKLDWLGDPISKISPTAISQLKIEGTLQTDEQNIGLFWLQLNLNRFPFQNVNIRKALAYGTNRQALIQDVLHSEDTPAFGFSYRPDPSFKSSFQDGDTESALRFFHKGLKELNLTVKDLPPIVISHSEIEEQEEISRALGNQWSKLFGVEISYNKLLWNSYFNALHCNDLMVGGIAWYARFLDPIYYYDLFVFKEHAVRVTSWRNSTYSRLIDEVKHTFDRQKKELLLQKAEKILLDAMPVIPLFYQKLRYVKNPHLKGYILSNTNQIDFRTAYIENSKGRNA